MPDWYVYDEGSETGPIGQDAAITFLQTKNPARVHVWREGLNEWMLVRDVPELAAAVKLRSAKPAPAVTCGPRTPAAPPDDDPRFTNILARHWRGELPLWASCWVFGIVGSIILSFIPAVTVAIFKAGKSHDPSSVLSASAAVWIVIFTIAVWQTAGVWRCTTRHAAAGPTGHDRMGAARLAPLWAGMARIVVVVSFVSLLATFGTEWLPQLSELYKIAFYDDPDIPPYSIRIVRDGAEAEIVGGFKYGLTGDFAAVMKAAPLVRIVHLDSVGGRLGEGERLFRLIRELGLSTYVSSKCLSACTLAFAGGRERLLEKGAALGFHRGSFPGASESEFDSLQYGVFAAAGFDSTFIEKALSTPHKDLWKPPPDILLAARVITGVIDGTAFPPGNATFLRHVFASQ